MPTMNEILKVLVTPIPLERMGFRFGRLPGKIPKDDLEGRLVMEDEWAGMAVDLCFSLVCHRLCRLLFHWGGFPGLFALLLGDEADQHRCLGVMKDVWEAWEAAQEQHQTRFLKGFLDRSFMRHELVKHFFRLALAVDFSRCTPAMRVQAEDAYVGVGQTQVIELAMNRFRRSEQKETENKHLSLGHVWLSPIKANILSGEHRFQEVDPSSYNLSGSDPKILPANMFRPLKRKATLNMKGIVGRLPYTAWPTFSAQSSVRVYAEMQIIMEAHRQNAWHAIENYWLAMLMAPAQLYRKVGTTTWFFCLGQAWQSASLGWPVTEEDGYVTPMLGASIADVAWMVVLEVEHWECQPVLWHSPVQCCMAGGLARPKGIVAKKVGPVLTYLQAAAKECFFKLSQPTIKKILGMVPHTDPGTTLFENLKCLITALLPGATDEEIMDILQKRLKPPPATAAELLSDDVVESAFDQDDQKAVLEFVNKVSSKQMSAFGEELVKARRVLNEGGGARGSKARKTAKGSKAMSSRSNRQYPVAVPPSLTKEACNGCMPPGARCFVDGLENRYRVVFKPWGCFSRSWTLHGEAEAYRLVCCWAWNLHTSATGEGCPIAGVMVDPDI